MHWSHLKQKLPSKACDLRKDRRRDRHDVETKKT
jgi:hypothetical protein